MSALREFIVSAHVIGASAPHQHAVTAASLDDAKLRLQEDYLEEGRHLALIDGELHEVKTGPIKPGMTPRTGETMEQGQKTEPTHALIHVNTPLPGQYIAMTDGTWRRVLKAEQTLHTDSNRVMLTATVLLEPAEERWLDHDPHTVPF